MNTAQVIERPSIFTGITDRSVSRADLLNRHGAIFHPLRQEVMDKLITHLDQSMPDLPQTSVGATWYVRDFEHDFNAIQALYRGKDRGLYQADVADLISVAAAHLKDLEERTLVGLYEKSCDGRYPMLTVRRGLCSLSLSRPLKDDQYCAAWNKTVSVLYTSVG